MTTANPRARFRQSVLAPAFVTLAPILGVAGCGASAPRHDWKASHLTSQRDTGMPTDSMIIVAAITLIFVTFAASIAWADFYGSGFRAPGEKHFNVLLRLFAYRRVA